MIAKTTAAFMSAAIAFCAWPASAFAASDVSLAAHRAAYVISLKRASERSGIQGADGALVLEVAGSPCEGWTLNFQMRYEFALTGGRTRELDSRTTMWESGAADAFRYIHKQYVDGKLQQEKQLRANKSASGGNGKITKPKPEDFALPANVQFPVEHQFTLVRAAKAGELRDATQLFDGADDGKPVSAITFFGKAKQAKEMPPELKQLEGQTVWPATISYFRQADTQKETPHYQVSMQLYENGVSGTMLLDHGDFVLEAKLTEIEMLPQEACKAKP